MHILVNIYILIFQCVASGAIFCKANIALSIKYINCIVKI